MLAHGPGWVMPEVCKGLFVELTDVEASPKGGAASDTEAGVKAD